MVSAVINEAPIRISDNVHWQTTHEFYEKNHGALLALILLSVASPFIGLFLAGWWGIMAGLLLGAVSYVLGPKAVTKVREIRSG